MTDPIRLTSLAHGGGCGCKLAPSVLKAIMAELPIATAFKDLMVGADTSDDAAVWRLNDHQALVATTDFFTPIVDDPYEFGRIAATNALSDIYAMGATPIFALAIVGMPIAKMPVEMIRAILAGGTAVCAAAGIPVAGGHSIDSAEPIYGLVALGLVHPDHVLKNNGARAGDVLILTKPLGVGVYSAALKQNRLDAAGYAALIASTTQLNTVGKSLSAISGVHSVTDVTGFGLLGHALEMARGSDLCISIEAEAAPLHLGVESLAKDGVRTGAAVRNWESYGDAIALSDEIQPWRRDLLCDPQTSGGLLIAVAPDVAKAVLSLALASGFSRAAIIGHASEGSPLVHVT